MKINIGHPRSSPAVPSCRGGAGSVVEVNDRLADEPELVNTDPYGDGWMIVMEPTVADELETNPFVKPEMKP